MSASASEVRFVVFISSSSLCNVILFSQNAERELRAPIMSIAKKPSQIQLCSLDTRHTRHDKSNLQ